jgi:hypothetical protein
LKFLENEKENNKKGERREEQDMGSRETSKRRREAFLDNPSQQTERTDRSNRIDRIDRQTDLGCLCVVNCHQCEFGFAVGGDPSAEIERRRRDEGESGGRSKGRRKGLVVDGEGAVLLLLL